MQAEAIAQARAIARLNAASVHGDGAGAGFITANLQWEVLYSTGRIDLLTYDRADPNGPIELIELKGVWNGGDASASRQLTGYETDLPKGLNNRPVVRHFFPEGYADAFRVLVNSCQVAGTKNQVVNQYLVSASSPGVLLIAGPAQQVTPCDQVGTEDIPAEEPVPENVPEDVQEPDAPHIYPAPGRDSDDDGRDDFWEKFLEEHPELNDLPAWPELPPVPVPDDQTIIVTAAALLLIVAVVGICIGTAGGCLVALPAVAVAEAGAISVGTVVAALALLTAGLAAWSVWGDPHIVTLDRFSYDLQAVGEFHLLEIPDENIDIQTRFKPLGSNISMLDRVITEVGDHRVEIGANFAKVNGKAISLPSGGVAHLDDGASLVRQGDTYILTWPGTGERLVLILKGQNVGFIVPPGADTQGLLGKANGDPSDDLATREGEVFPVGASASTIHGRYADSWRVTDQDSLFSYGAGQSTATFTDKNFPANIVTIADFSEAEQAAASAACVAAGVVPGPQFEDCIFDVAQTGDNSYANAAALVTDVLVDSKAHGFDDAGTLSEDFEGTVGSNFASSRYSSDSSTSRVAGPIFDTPGYRMFARGILKSAVVRS